MIGFPLNYGIGDYFSPLSRQTRAASGLITIEKSVVFFTEDPSVQGYSGSPILYAAAAYFDNDGLNLKPRFVKLWGVVSATSADNTGGKLGHIVPGFIIRNLALKAIADERLKNRIQQYTSTVRLKDPER